MSLKPRINVEFGLTTLVVYDTTCKYDSCANVGGYGTPNELTSTATAATVEITIPDVATPVIIDVFPYLPNSTGVGFEIDLEDLGVTEIVPGEWKFKYSVSFSTDTTYEKECWFLNTCPIDKCLAGRVLKIDTDCSCSNDYDNETFRLINLLKGAKEIHCTGDYTKAHKVAISVYNTCNCDCGC